MTSPTIGVLALQGDFREHLQALQRLDVHAVTVRRIEELDRCDGLVIPGGESTTMAKLAKVFDVFDGITERIAAGLPTFGTCAGMIMLADRLRDGTDGQETLGGLDVTVRRNAFGRQVDSFEADLDFAGLDAPVHAVFIRAPWIEQAGVGVDVLATVGVDDPAPGGGAWPWAAEGRGGGAGPWAAEGRGGGAGPWAAEGTAPTDRIVAVQQGPLLATSFHPEVDDDLRVHRHFLDIVTS